MQIIVNNSLKNVNHMMLYEKLIIKYIFLIIKHMKHGFFLEDILAHLTLI